MYIVAQPYYTVKDAMSSKVYFVCVSNAMAQQIRVNLIKRGITTNVYIWESKWMLFNR